VRFENKIYFFCLGKNALSCYNDGFIVVNAEVVRLATACIMHTLCLSNDAKRWPKRVNNSEKIKVLYQMR
jgi:hypothetical protein